MTLIKAATYNYKSIAPLLKAGADVFYKNKKGMNALMAILRPNRRYNRGYDYYPSFLSLLAAGGDVNAQDNKGRTALMLAIKYRAKAVQPLIDAGANVNTRKRSGWTALMYAAEYSPNSIPLLISAGADVNTRTNDGWTALMYAARYNTKAIRNLLDEGAKTEPESNKKTKKFPSGSTALDIAKLTENQERVQVITVYIEENKTWELAQKEHNYKDYLASYPHGKHVQQAIGNIEKLKKVANLIAQLKSKQTCNLDEENWFYTSNACQEGMAHGVGSATNGKGLSFKGEFKSGARVEGELYLENELMYKGFIVNSRPHGDGTCMFKGKTEPCTYSHGERVDTPYKERLEQKRLAFEAQNAKEDTGSLEYFIKYTSHKAVDMLIKEAFNNLF
ncbi:MAG: ankyrin repeat domain-containing protein [Bermanella sp.]